MRFLLLCLTLTLAASPSPGQQAALRLSAPAALAETGLLKHILPRFSLKTGVRVIAENPGDMVLATEPPGMPVFQRAETVYYLRTGDDARQTRFLDWLTSEVGRRTVAGFKPADGTVFVALDAAPAETGPLPTGDAVLGARLSQVHCGRCHAISPERRLSGIGSTPSFMVLRALPDWEQRFSAFFTLNPHPAFTQIEGLTEPFDPERPPPIHPVTIRMSDLEAILAHVAAIVPADLGAPLALQ